jgi:hypothetical protein
MDGGDAQLPDIRRWLNEWGNSTPLPPFMIGP